jgi:hypothetical protein
MGLIRQASFNPTLTAYASGLAQDINSAIADAIAPPVNVQSTVGAYKLFDAKNQFQSPDTARAVGGGANRIQMLASDPTYSCQPQALEITIDDAEADAAGPDLSFLEQAKIKTLISAAVTSHERKVMVAAAASISATGSTGVWSPTETNDPIADIDGVMYTIATATGMLPNTIIFGLAAWNRFKTSSKTRARFPGATIQSISPGMISGLFLNPAVRILLSPMAYDTAKWGATKSNSGIVGSDVWVCHSSASPTVYDNSFMKTFRAGRNGGSVQSVRTYRDESARSTVYAVDWSEDIKVVSSASCARITTS